MTLAYELKDYRVLRQKRGVQWGGFAVNKLMNHGGLNQGRNGSGGGK